MPARPTGVTVLAVLTLLGAAFELLLGLLGGAFGMLGGVQGAAAGDAQIAGGGALLGVLGVGFLLLGLFGLLVGYGLYTLKGWAWTTAVVLQSLNLLLGLVNAAQGSLTNALPMLLVAGLILYYLFRPHVKQAFGKA